MSDEGTTGEREPVRLGVVAAMSLDGPAVALLMGEATILVSVSDAALFGQAVLREAHRGEGFALMAAAMRDAGLSDRTIYRALDRANRANRGRGE